MCAGGRVRRSGIPPCIAAGEPVYAGGWPRWQGGPREMAGIEEGAREGLAGASDARYRVLFEASPLPMWVYDAKTLQFLAVNDAAVRHYGWSRDEFLAMGITDIRPRADVDALMINL